MIRINLAEKKTSGVEYGTSGRSIQLDTAALKRALAGAKELPLQKYILAIGVCIAASIYLSGFEDDQVSALQAQEDRINAETIRLKAMTGKMKSLEELKKSMEDDEFVIQTKLDTVRKLIANRSSAGTVLIELSKVAPAQIWFKDFELKDSTDVTMAGFAPDLSMVSDFMKALSESSVFSDPALKEMKQGQGGRRPTATFAIEARKR